MANTKGYAVIWALGSLSNITNFGAYKMQENGYKRKSEKWVGKDENGESFSRVDYDYTEQATFRYIPAAASGSASIVLPTNGDAFSITDPVAGQISGSGWIVDDAGWKRTTESPLVADIEATRYNGGSVIH